MSQEVITLAFPANILRIMWDIHMGNPIPGGTQEARTYENAFWIEIQHALENKGQI